MSMLRNDDFDFEKQAPPDHRLAFRGAPRKVVLHPPANLYRFVSLPNANGTGFKGNELFLSPWWLPLATFRALTKLSTRTGASIRDSARSRLAVTEDWNPTMDTVAIIELRAPVVAWRGAISHQPASMANRSVLLLGGFDQLYVPNLADDDIGLSSRVAMLMYHGTLE